MPTRRGPRTARRARSRTPSPRTPRSIRERHGYNSWANLTHAGSFALPYAELDGSDYGVFGTTLWLEPLGKHVFVGLVSVSIPKFAEQTLGFLSYTNNQFRPTLTLNAYRYPSPARWYGSSLLVEDLVGGDLTATLPLDLTTAPFTSTSVDARVRYAYADPFDDSAFDEIETTGLVRPEAGYRSEVRLGFTATRQRPYRYNDIYPLDGVGLRARVTGGLPVLGSDAEFVRPDLSAYWVSPQLGIGRFYVYGRAQARFGDALAQDFVGLSRYDDIDLQLPFVEPITLSDVGARARLPALRRRRPPALRDARIPAPARVRPRDAAARLPRTRPRLAHVLRRRRRRVDGERPRRRRSGGRASGSS